MAFSRIKQHPRVSGTPFVDVFEGERSERHTKPVMCSLLGQKLGKLIRAESATRQDDPQAQDDLLLSLSRVRA